MKIQDDGTIQYVGKRILDNGIDNIPRYQYQMCIRDSSYSGGIVLFHSSDITSKPKRYISENGGIVHELSLIHIYFLSIHLY